MAAKSIEAMEECSHEIAGDVRIMEKEMNRTESELRLHHMKRISDGKCSPEFTVIYTDVVHNIEKIGDYCNNIAEAVEDNVVEKSE